MLLYVVTLKVYEEIDGEIQKKWYRVQNAKNVLDMDICSRDTINIKGIGKLEVLGVHYQERNSERNPYKSMEITCGIFNN